MAINTLFQNIADAIREKTGSAGSLTPAQMPGAIRSISSGGLTADLLAGPVNITSGGVINLLHPYTDYDAVLLNVIVSNQYIENQFYLTGTLETGKRMGIYDDAAYTWFNIVDTSTLQQAAGRTGVTANVYGLKWGG